MKFLIYKTSTRGEKPCEKSYLSTYIWTYKPTLMNDLEEWKSKGFNHRIENGWHVRDEEEYGWFIDINSIEELMDLKEEVGQDLIITKEYWSGLPAIEIYDDYRE